MLALSSTRQPNDVARRSGAKRLMNKQWVIFRSSRSASPEAPIQDEKGLKRMKPRDCHAEHCIDLIPSSLPITHNCDFATRGIPWSVRNIHCITVINRYPSIPFRALRVNSAFQLPVFPAKVACGTAALCLVEDYDGITLYMYVC